MKIKSIITAIVLSAVFLLSNVANAQRNDNLIRVDDVFNGNRDLSTLAATSFVLGGAQGEDPTAPLGSGLLILTAAGAGYVVAKRKRSIRTGGTLLISCAMLLSLTQCKKNIVAPESTGEGVHISLTVGYNGDRTGFTPSGDGSTGSFVWTNDATEYLYVGSENKGYIGSLSGTGNGTNQMTFEGTLTKTPATDEKMYFFYLGNGEHPDATSISFANQDGSIGNVTNYHVAISDAIPYNGEGPYGSAEYPVELKMKMAIAKFDLSGFGNENVYIHGDDVYAQATIDWNHGAIVGEDYYWKVNNDTYVNKGHGYIKITSPDEETYVALIPTEANGPTTMKFDSNSKTNSKSFLNGIKAGKYYSNSGAAIVITGNELPAGTLKGLFSVDGTGKASTKKIRFSKGNLQYQPSANNWRLAGNQWDFIGYYVTFNNQGHKGNVEGSENQVTYTITGGVYDYEGWMDLFGWGAASNPTSNTLEDQTDNDFGEIIGGGWRLLSAVSSDATSSEWNYLFVTRSTLLGGVNGVRRYGRGTVNGAKGLILLPDDWDMSITWFKYENAENTNTKYTDTNNIFNETTTHKWSDMEKAGCVFLPVTGYCGSSLNGLIGDYPQGYYWTYSENGNNGYEMYFLGNSNSNATNAKVECEGNNSKTYRRAVRLVRDIN